MRRSTPIVTERKLFARTWLPGLFTLLVGVSCGGDSTGPKTVTSLRFSPQPTTVAAGAPFSVTVELADGTARATGASGQSVDIRVLGGGAISGPSSVVASHGLATFVGLTITHAGTGIQLIATSGTITSTSMPFSILAGPADVAHSAVDPAPCTAPTNAAFPLSFSFGDAYGNPVPFAAVTLASTLVGSSLAPSSGATAQDGTFATTFASTTAGTTAISANVGGQQLAFTPAFVIASPAAPTPMAFPGSVTGTIPAAACVSDFLSAAGYSFTMPATGGAAFTITSAFTPVFEVQPGADLNVRVKSSTTPVTVEWLLPAGPFQFAIGTAAGTGEYSIVGASVPANTGCDVRLLVAGGTYTGQALAPGDCAFTNGTLFDFFVMDSALPCTITLQTSAFDKVLAVFDDVTGDPVGNFIHPSPGVDAVIQLGKCASGDDPIAILASSFSPGGSGAYTLIVAMQGAGPANLRTISTTPPTTAPVDARGFARMLRVAAAMRGGR